MELSWCEIYTRRAAGAWAAAKRRRLEQMKGAGPSSPPRGVGGREAMPRCPAGNMGIEERKASVSHHTLGAHGLRVPASLGCRQAGTQGVAPGPPKAGMLKGPEQEPR